MRANKSPIFSCGEKRIYFTASGTEADNWAIKGAAKSE
jgi:cysteine sulfinate desulfinase/cysteine desulfurase-like protein